ncbi:bifunctional DNA primase/polymerase [Streptomyces sp. NPDC088816]|uniref:bifunctional DNA primase/polymerase n=1 Tax=Streptomyces sp. NPDC088816 TaxID=3365906 RepID=UPI0038254E5A
MRCEALKYADEQGWRVLPLRQKKPLLAEWQHRATTDSRTIERWGMWGQADGVGIATGAESGLLVLDVDGPTGEEAIDSKDLPPTWSQVTGRDGGGRHLLYSTRDRLGSKSYKALSLDIRAEGGYIVAAPSMHPSGRRYLAQPAPLAPVPQWLADMAGPAPEAQGGSATGLPGRVVRALKTSAQGRRSEELFVIYRWALNNEIPDLEVVGLVQSHPIASKVRDKSDPTRWILDDLQRFRERQVDPVSITPQWHIERTSAVVSTLPSTRQKLIRALQDLAVKRGNTEVVVSRDDLAILASVGTATVTRNMPLLVSDGLIRLVGSRKTSGTLANCWGLRIPPRLLQQGQGGDTRGDKSGPLPAPPKDCGWKGSGNDTPMTPLVSPPCAGTTGTGRRVTSSDYLKVLGTPKTRAELERELGAQRRTVQRNLAKLVDQGLVERVGHAYQRTSQGSLDVVGVRRGDTPVSLPCGQGTQQGRHPRDTPLDSGVTSVDPSHDASRWKALGAAWRYLEALTRPKTRAELERELGAQRRTVQRNLAKLVEWGLVVADDAHTYRRADRWQERLSEVAAMSGTTGRKAIELRRLEVAREQRRLERIRSARSRGVEARGVELVDVETGEVVSVLVRELLPEETEELGHGTIGPFVLAIGRGRVKKRYQFREGRVVRLKSVLRAA